LRARRVQPAAPAASGPSPARPRPSAPQWPRAGQQRRKARRRAPAPPGAAAGGRGPRGPEVSGARGGARSVSSRPARGQPRAAADSEPQGPGPARRPFATGAEAVSFAIPGLGVKSLGIKSERDERRGAGLRPRSPGRKRRDPSGPAVPVDTPGQRGGGKGGGPGRRGRAGRDVVRVRSTGPRARRRGCFARARRAGRLGTGPGPAGRGTGGVIRRLRDRKRPAPPSSTQARKLLVPKLPKFHSLEQLLQCDAVGQGGSSCARQHGEPHAGANRQQQRTQRTTERMRRRSGMTMTAIRDGGPSLGMARASRIARGAPISPCRSPRPRPQSLAELAPNPSHRTPRWFGSLAGALRMIRRVCCPGTSKRSSRTLQGRSHQVIEFGKLKHSLAVFSVQCEAQFVSWQVSIEGLC
jgi:hypothetical protein